MVIVFTMAGMAKGVLYMKTGRQPAEITIAGTIREYG